MKTEIRQLLAKVYKHPQFAFGEFDPEGTGKLTV